MSKAILNKCQTFLFGFFFIGLIPYLSGQSTAGIQGKIIDQEGLPIPQAYVFVDQTTYKPPLIPMGFIN